MSGTAQPLTARELQLSERMSDWRVLADTAATWFAASSYSDGARLVARLVGIEGDSRPDLDVRADGARVSSRLGNGPCSQPTMPTSFGSAVMMIGSGCAIGILLAIPKRMLRASDFSKAAWGLWFLESVTTSYTM